MRWKAAHIRVVGLITAMFFVAPTTCLCGPKHQRAYNDATEVQDHSRHCHDESTTQQSSESKKNDCCGSSQYKCVQDVVVDSGRAELTAAQHTFDHEMDFLIPASFLGSYFSRGSPKMVLLQHSLPCLSRSIYIQNQTLLI